jgi:hypothetical protein
VRGSTGAAREFTYRENESFETRLFRGGALGPGDRPPGGGFPGYPGRRGRLRRDDQNRFDTYYARWLASERANNRLESFSTENLMFDIYAAYGIPRSVPFDRVASRR